MLKLKLTLLHIHLPATKAHSLGFQPQALLDRRITAQLNLSARTEHALPRQPKAAIQNASHQPRRPGQTGSLGYRSIS